MNKKLPDFSQLVQLHGQRGDSKLHKLQETCFLCLEKLIYGLKL